MSEKQRDTQVIVFDDFVIDLEQRSLFRGSSRVHLPKKPFAVLEYLIEHRGQLVTRDALLDQFWNGAASYDEAVYRCISAIRKALGDTDEQARYLETRWKEGYRFIAEVQTGTQPTADDQPEPATPLAEDADALPRTATGRGARTYGALAALAVVAAGLWWFSQRAPMEPAGEFIESIAVLPVEGRDSEAWMLEGLTDELIHVTSNIEGVRVISAGRAAQDAVDPAALGRRLGADALLQTRLVETDGAATLRVQLIQSTDGTILWSFRAPYDANAGSAATSGVIAGLANRLSARLKTTPASPPKQGNAWLKYLRARQEWRLRTPQSIASAIALYQEIIDAEPDFADAHAGLAEAMVVASLYTGADPVEAYAAARDSATRAMELDPMNARAHAALAAYYSQHEFDWPEAERLFARAIEIDPNNPLAHQWTADAYCYRLMFDECRYHLSAARSLDPLSPHLDLFQGIPDRFSRNFEEAERKFRDTLTRFPDFALARFQLGLVLDAQGRFDEAIEQWERIYPQYGPTLLASSLANAYAQTGSMERARALHSELRELREEGYLSAVMMAGVALTEGDRSAALDWLEVAYEERDDFVTSIAVIHHFHELLNEPRFIALASRIGISEERIAAFAGSDGR